MKSEPNKEPLSANSIINCSWEDPICGVSMHCNCCVEGGGGCCEGRGLLCVVRDMYVVCCHGKRYVEL